LDGPRLGSFFLACCKMGVVLPVRSYTRESYFRTL
jgi:hypothetical protein